LKSFAITFKEKFMRCKVNTLRRFCRYAVSSGHVLLTMIVINSLSFAADPGKNGKIAFIGNLTGTNQIYTVNPDGTDLFQVTNLPPASDPFALAPDFSPDGKRIVFPYATTGAPGALGLYVVNADGSDLTQITHDGRGYGLPRWSPDGSHILVATAGKHNTLVIATMRSDGTDLKLLTTPFWDSLGASYTPDGKHIVFSSQQGGLISALWIMDIDGKHQRRLTDPELEAGPPDVSSDGKQVVFYTHQDTPKPTSIFKINIDGSGVTRLTSEGHMDTLPVFSPDGKKIAYMSDRLSPGSFDTWTMNADGSNKRRVILGAFAPNWGVQP
jgi:Tol biopolymer transport system component